MCTYYMPNWSIVLKNFDKGSNVSYFLAHRSSWFLSIFLVLFFPGTGPKMEEKGEDDGGILECLGSQFHLFSYLYLFQFHKGFELVVWVYKEKKKVAEQNFPFVIPKTTTIKMGVYFW